MALRSQSETPILPGLVFQFPAECLIWTSNHLTGVVLAATHRGGQPLRTCFWIINWIILGGFTYQTAKQGNVYLLHGKKLGLHFFKQTLWSYIDYFHNGLANVIFLLRSTLCLPPGAVNKILKSISAEYERHRSLSVSTIQHKIWD